MLIVKRQFIDGTHGQIHLRIAKPEHPTRHPLVCTHMFPQSGRSFEKFLSAASNERVIVAPDFPGHGESDAPSEKISAEEYAAAMWEVVDALTLLKPYGKIDLFGVHAGAKLAVEMANQRSSDVRKIVLSSAAVLLPDEVKQLKNSFKTIPLDEEGTRVSHLWKLITRNRHKNMSLEFCASAFAEMLRGGEKYEWGHHAVFDYNSKFPEVLRTITQPVALLNPRDELYEMTRRSLDYLQNATLFDLQEWSHGYLDAHTDTVSELVNGWLDSEPTEKAENEPAVPKCLGNNSNITNHEQ